MSLRLRTSGGTSLARAPLAATLAVVLTAVVLALLPAAAEAQTGTQAKDGSAPSVVVRPGDSLWSISQERLGPDATPQRVAGAAERIHALNRGRIGADPNLIFVGQELLLPPALSGRPTGATPAPKTGEAADAGERDRAAEGTTGSKATGKAPRTASGGAAAEGGDVPAPVAEPKAEREAEREAERGSQRGTEPVSLPDQAAVEPVPAARALASDDAQHSPVASFLRTIRAELSSAVSAVAEASHGVSAETRADGRRMLGLGIVLLTLVAAVLMARRLPMRRTTRRDAERWGTPAGHHGYHSGAPATRRAAPFAYHSGSLGGADASPAHEGRLRAPEEAPGHKRGTLRRAPDAQTLRSRAEAYILRPESREEASPGNHEATNGDASAASRIRKAAAGGRERVPKAKKVKAVARNGLALGAHDPEVRRAPLRARATMRARRLRPRLRHGRGVSARGGR